MSQPEQDLTHQVRRHRGPIFGIVIVVLLVIGFFLWWVGYELDEAGPTPSGEQIEGQVAPTAPAPVAPDQPGGAPAPETAPSTSSSAPPAPSSPEMRVPATGARS